MCVVARSHVEAKNMQQRTEVSLMSMNSEHSSEKFRWTSGRGDIDARISSKNVVHMKNSRMCLVKIFHRSKRFSVDHVDVFAGTRQKTSGQQSSS